MLRIGIRLDTDAYTSYESDPLPQSTFGSIVLARDVDYVYPGLYLPTFTSEHIYNFSDARRVCSITLALIIFMDSSLHKFSISAPLILSTSLMRISK